MFFNKLPVFCSVCGRKLLIKSFDLTSPVYDTQTGVGRVERREALYCNEKWHKGDGHTFQYFGPSITVLLHDSSN